MNPVEIICSPYEIYITTGTDAFPDVQIAPSGGWILLGTNGKNNQAEGGVTVENTQTLNYVRVEGRTGPAKAYRTEEDQKVSFTLLDMSLAQYKHALSGNAPTASGTTADYIGLSRSEFVREVKLLVRGPSPAHENRNAQFEIPRAVQSGAPSVALSKGAPTGLAFEFTSLEDLSTATTGERFGRFVVCKG